MIFRAEIDVMPLDEILDPQGKAVKHGLQNLGIAGLQDVRVGRHITLLLDADSADAAYAQAETACKKLLANLIIEGYRIAVHA